MKKIVVLFVSLLSLISCLDNVSYPLIITGKVTDIDKDGAVFHAKITALGDRDILEFGFVWDTIHNPTIDKAEKYIFQKQPELGNFNTKIYNSLETQKTYYVRAFIRDANITTYGQETFFVSQGGKLPEIDSILPVSGNLLDTMVIVGKYFSKRNSTVMIDQENAEIVKINQDSIFVIIPPRLVKKTSDVRLTYLDQTIIAKDSFTLISPVISSFEAKTGTYGDEVIIKGENFSESPSTVKVFFDNAIAAYNIIDDQTIKSIVPNNVVILIGYGPSVSIIMIKT